MINFIKKLLIQHKYLETDRLILRHWKENDAKSLFQYARDKDVGPMAGWNPHQSIEESRFTINNLFNDPNFFAIVYKPLNRPIGCIGISIGKESNLPLSKDEGEIGYWLGKPFWGKGLMPEATRRMIRYGFEDLGLRNLWCGYFEGNEQSKRVQEKCGFIYQHTLKDQYWKTTQEIKTEHITLLTQEDYLRKGRINE